VDAPSPIARRDPELANGGSISHPGRMVGPRPLWHLACWNDVVTTQLTLMRTGEFDDGFEWDTDENNARFLETGRSITFSESLSALERSRTDVIHAMEQLETVSPRALELFSEPAYMHVDDHLSELRRFLGIDAQSEGSPT
jgi:hypothetical protein